ERGRGARHHDGGGRGHERERWGDHLVAPSHAERGEGQPERVGAGTHADTVAGAAARGHLGLQRLALGAEHEPAAPQHPPYGHQPPPPARRALPHPVHERTHRSPLPSGAPRPIEVRNGPPMPSKLTPNATSSSFPSRWMNSTVSDQHWKRMSPATRLSTNRPLRAS